MENENIYLLKIIKSIESCNNFVQLKSCFNLIELFNIKFPFSNNKENIIISYFEKELKLTYK